MRVAATRRARFGSPARGATVSMIQALRGRLATLQVRALIVAALAVVVLVTIGVGVLAVVRVRAATAQVAAMADSNVQRLTVMGDIRGEQARINDGAVRQFGSGLPPTVRAIARHDMAVAARSMDHLMSRYEALVRGTPAGRS